MAISNIPSFVAWATDIHLDHASPADIQTFVVRVKDSGASALLLGGDISNAATVERHLVDLADLLGIPIHFVLGNHDYYGGSIAGVRKRMGRLDHPSLHWLPGTGPQELAPGVALVGHGGWGDARLGDFAGSDVVLSDYIAIVELARAFGQVEFTGKFGENSPLQAELRRLGQDAADTLAPQLAAAAATSAQVVVLTHVPPFREASWHEGRISGETWLPAFSCGAVGEVLTAVAGEYPDCRFTVLCGHTHGEGTVQMADNLFVRTQGAVYGRPDIVLLDALIDD